MSKAHFLKFVVAYIFRPAFLVKPGYQGIPENDAELGLGESKQPTAADLTFQKWDVIKNNTITWEPFLFLLSFVYGLVAGDNIGPFGIACCYMIWICRFIYIICKSNELSPYRSLIWAPVLSIPIPFWSFMIVKSLYF
mmetsp:Transcript_13042/g.23056  ORF Transcript_13042/g.23056 Transcript_13042/m.23056 type:complete len:138 (+) Transcript_13042:122-535(+)